MTAAARQRVAAAVRAGNSIEATRLYRADTRASLTEARNAVEVMTAILSVASAERFVAPAAESGGCAVKAVVILIVLAATTAAWHFLR